MPDTPKQKARRLTRCRTGCMRCRVRRRKCDEGKPRCRNCVDRDFDCQYGPQLTFLTKNAHTVQPSEVGKAPASYDTIRFVNEDPQKDGSDPDEPNRESSAPAGEPSDVHHEAAGSSTPRPRRRADVELLLWPADIHASNPTSQPVATVFSDNDESAVAGLLALGTSTNDMMCPDLSLSDFAVSPSAREVSMDQGPTPSKYPDFSADFSPAQLSHTAHANLGITPTETLELLRHYRYEVAPWLDICDLGQLFGIKGLQLAMISRPVWISVLTLSEASVNLLRPLPSHTRIDKALRGPATPTVQLDITTIALIRALDEAKKCMTNISAAWASQRGRDKDLLEALIPHTVGRDFKSAIYWLFVRLDLGAALAADTNIQIPLPQSPPYFSDGDLGIDPFAQVFCYAHRPLWLCARAVEFVHNEDPLPKCPPLHAWTQLVEELEQWYQERPQGFQPMLELDMDDQMAGSTQSFPVVLFANGLGVFANQLYHTAMLLLLHSRPRTARIAEYHSATMSPLWHAQRICSIALNNERQECWDPCLLASFLTAARRMTHESQQQEILHGFKCIRRVTGWEVGDLLQGLQTEWGFVEP